MDWLGMLADPITSLDLLPASYIKILMRSCLGPAMMNSDKKIADKTAARERGGARLEMR